MIGRVQPHPTRRCSTNLAGDDGLASILPLRRLASCEIVVLTSLSDPHAAAHARLVGAQAWLHKTAPNAELMACLFAGHRSCEGAAPSNEVGIVSHLDGSKHPSAQGRTNDVGHGTDA